MASLICEICGKDFKYQKEASCRAQLNNHIRKEHNITIEEYVVQTQYNGLHPICPCGCGKELHLQHKGWKFNKYATDVCYSNVVKSANKDIINKVNKATLNKFDLKEYYKQHYDIHTYEYTVKLFRTKEWPLTDISKKFSIDKRTLKKVWLALDLITVEEIENLTNYYRFQFSFITKNKFEVDSSDSYLWMYMLIKNNPGKYNIRSLLKYFNEKHDKKITSDPNNVYTNLKRLYGDEIDIYLSYGLHSNEEYQFYNVLKFYFPELGNKIIVGKKFTLPNKYIIYDLFLNKTLLIEYDSTGKYHDPKNDQDKLKEEFAINNGYKFLRLTKSDIKNPQTIEIIKKSIYD